MKDYGNDATKVKEMGPKLATAHFVAQALDALNFLESSLHGGPDDPEVYAEVMIEVGMHCTRAAQQALENEIWRLKEKAGELKGVLRD